jgi:hypothetical protein
LDKNLGLGCGSHLEPLFYEGKKMDMKIKTMWGKLKLLKLFIPHYLLIKKHKKVCSMVVEYNFRNDQKPPLEYEILHKFFKKEFGVNVCCFPDSVKEAKRYWTEGNKIEKVRITVEGNFS